jgi:hypothetical protein
MFTWTMVCVGSDCRLIDIQSYDSPTSADVGTANYLREMFYDNWNIVADRDCHPDYRRAVTLQKAGEPRNVFLLRTPVKRTS